MPLQLARGFGGVLLPDASSRIVAATEVVATRFVVVDAMDDKAAHFYPDVRVFVNFMPDLGPIPFWTSSAKF